MCVDENQHVFSSTHACLHMHIPHMHTAHEHTHAGRHLRARVHTHTHTHISTHCCCTGVKLSDGHIVYEWPPPSGYLYEGEIFEISVPIITDDLSDFNDHSDDGMYGDVDTVRDTNDEDEEPRQVRAGGMHDAGMRLRDDIHTDDVDGHSRRKESSFDAAAHVHIGGNHARDSALPHTCTSSTEPSEPHLCNNNIRDEDGQTWALHDSKVGQDQVVEATTTDVDAIADLFPWLKDSITTEPSAPTTQLPHVGLTQTQTVIVEQVKQPQTGAGTHVYSMDVDQADTTNKGDVHMLDNDHLASCSAPECVAVTGARASDMAAENQGARDQVHHEAARSVTDAAVLQPWLNVWGDDVFEPSDRSKESRQEGDVDAGAAPAHGVHATESHVMVSEPRDSEDADILKAMQLSLRMAHGGEQGIKQDTMVSESEMKRESQDADLLKAMQLSLNSMHDHDDDDDDDDDGTKGHIKASESESEAPRRDSQDADLLAAMQLSLKEQEMEAQIAAAVEWQAEQDLRAAMQLSQSENVTNMNLSMNVPAKKAAASVDTQAEAEAEAEDLRRAMELSVASRVKKDAMMMEHPNIHVPHLEHNKQAGASHNGANGRSCNDANNLEYSDSMAEAGMSPRQRSDDDDAVSWKYELPARTPKRAKSNVVDALSMLVTMFPDYDAAVVEQVCLCVCVSVCMHVASMSVCQTLKKEVKSGGGMLVHTYTHIP
jgi:hypothetical protein